MGFMVRSQGQGHCQKLWHAFRHKYKHTCVHKHMPGKIGTVLHVWLRLALLTQSEQDMDSKRQERPENKQEFPSL